MSKFFIPLLFLIALVSNAQQNVLVPYRVGNKFGLSDLKGNIKVKPQYDMMEPVGAGYFKCANNQMGFDTTYRNNGRVIVEERIITNTGVYFGTKLIIENSRHRHFTFLEQGLFIGSEESYISKNSNFYNLKGERLLIQNLLKFKFIGGSNLENMEKEPTSIISIFAEHYDGSVSLLLFDTKAQKMLKPELEHVTNFDMDRDEGNGVFIVCSYNDSSNNYVKSKVYFDSKKKHYVVGPYDNDQHKSDFNGDEISGDYVVEEAYGGDYDVEEAPSFDITIQEEGYEIVESPNQINETPKPKPIFPFIKINDTTVKYGNDTLRAAAGEHYIFYDKYSNSQMQPLIIVKENKYGLVMPDSANSVVLYDSLRYVKNQYGIFTFNQTMMFLVGIKNGTSGVWKFGLLDQAGNEIIPIMYEYLSPNLPEATHDRDEITKEGYFKFRQPNDYTGDKNLLLTLTSEGMLVASKNGKLGVINLKNEILMPFEFDNLWRNGLSFLTTYEVDEDFCVYQKGDKYGVFKFDYNQKKTIDTGPIFQKIPVFVYRNYMGVNGLDIYNLAENDTLYFCLQSNDGTLYYKEK